LSQRSRILGMFTLSLILGIALCIAGLSLFLRWWRWTRAGGTATGLVWRILAIPVILIGLLLPVAGWLLDPAHHPDRAHQRRHRIDLPNIFIR
jgi:hypothetical protein